MNRRRETGVEHGRAGPEALVGDPEDDRGQRDRKAERGEGRELGIEGGAAAHVKDGIDALAVVGGKDRLLQVLSAGIDSGIGAEAFDHGALLLARGQTDHLRAGLLAELHRKRAGAAGRRLDQQGLAGFDAGAWNGLFLPKGTPAAIVQKLNDAVVGTLNLSAVQAKLQYIGVMVVAPERRSPAYLQNLVDSEIQKWAGPIKAAGVSVD